MSDGQAPSEERMNTVRLRMCLFVGLVAACSLGLAPERRQDDDLRGALEKRFAAPAFAVVRDAERVEALPVEETGMGLSATYREESVPSRSYLATARDMRRTVLSTKSYVGGPMACTFQPGLALRFPRAASRFRCSSAFSAGSWCSRNLEASGWTAS